jgi:hypothetical protein
MASSHILFKERHYNQMNLVATIQILYIEQHSLVL